MYIPLLTQAYAHLLASLRLTINQVKPHHILDLHEARVGFQNETSVE